MLSIERHDLERRLINRRRRVHRDLPRPTVNFKARNRIAQQAFNKKNNLLQSHLNILGRDHEWKDLIPYFYALQSLFLPNNYLVLIGEIIHNRHFNLSQLWFVFNCSITFFMSYFCCELRFVISVFFQL